MSRRPPPTAMAATETATTATAAATRTVAIQATGPETTMGMATRPERATALGATRAPWAMAIPATGIMATAGDKGTLVPRHRHRRRKSHHRLLLLLLQATLVPRATAIRAMAIMG